MTVGGTPCVMHFSSDSDLAATPLLQRRCIKETLGKVNNSAECKPMILSGKSLQIIN
jgi:hypothetical protein